MLVENNLIRPVLRHSDARGDIISVADSFAFSSILAITCKAGSIRAEHWHQQDYHLCLLTQGKMYYYERPLNSNERPTRIVIEAGGWFFTPSRTEHTMEFLEDSEFLCFSRLSRTHENYESDTVRLNFSLKKAYDEW